MKIFVSAAEISSDLQAEKILIPILKLYPEGVVQIAGIGGPKLRNIPGFECIQTAESLRAMGFGEVLAKFFFLRKSLYLTRDFVKKFKPDLILTFDYPDFHLRLLKLLENAPGLEDTVKICGIPPKLWVWRGHRIHQLKRFYTAVWVIFPFEEKLYQDHKIPVIYAGNPLIADLCSSPSQVKRAPDKEVIRLAVLPGSRDAELKYHLPLVPLVLKRLSELSGKKILAEVPVPSGLSSHLFAEQLISNESVTYQLSQGNSGEVLARNDLGLIKSGTSTLEAAVLGCAPVIFYRVSKSTEWIFRFWVRYLGPVGLPNILLGIKDRKKAIFPEYLGTEASAENLAFALFELSKDPVQVRFLQEQGNRLRSALVPQTSVGDEVARQIKLILEYPPEKEMVRSSKLWIGIVSFLWSCVNAFRRKLYDWKFFRTKLIPFPSVLVGNLQAGGTGKTPVVIEIAKRALERGFRVGIISRGYGGNYRAPFLLIRGDELHHTSVNEIGDEPTEILTEVPGAMLGLGSDRVRLVEELRKQGINFFIFDDGFQNLKFQAKRQVILVTSAKRNEKVYRDFDPATASADLILHTKGVLDPRWPTQTQKIEWVCDHLPSSPIWLLCGVADPDEVLHFYRNLKVQIRKVILQNDHATYDEAKVKTWEMQAKADGCFLAVTQKDAVKLKGANFSTLFILKRKIKNTDWLDSLIDS